MLKYLATLWLIFEKFAIAFSFVVNLILVIVLTVVVVTFLTWGPPPSKLRYLLPDVAMGLKELGETTIRTNVQIDESLDVNLDVPVQFDLPVEESTDVTLEEAVPLSIPADISFPSGGGWLHTTVSLRLPSETELPIQLQMSVPVSQTIFIREQVPVVMTVPAEIQLRETDLNKVVVSHFDELLGPYLNWWENLFRLVEGAIWWEEVFPASPASVEGTGGEDIIDQR